jgi:hypothetical protein
MTMGSEDALEVAHAFPDSTLVSVHNEGWGHLRESQDQLADVFRPPCIASLTAQPTLAAELSCGPPTPKSP